MVVPVFGTEEHLGDCLQSLLRQSFRNLEIVVVDDCSPGDVSGIVGRVAAGDHRVRLVRHETNQGLARVRLTGGREARGRYIGFVDSDDEVEQWFVQRLHAAAARCDADFVQCALQQFDPDGATWVFNRGGAAHQLRGEEILRGLLAGAMSNSLCTKLIRNTVWHAATDALDPELQTIYFGEDLLTMFLVALHSATFAHIPDAGYRWIRRATSVTLAAEAHTIAGCLDDLDRVYRAVHPLLADRAESPELVAAYFEREYAVVVRQMLLRAAACDPGETPGLPASPAVLGLLGALALDRIQPADNGQ
ncbi:unannotated protein [freshwater metagenome]|uniref:Unannotated protein n=1 Tax=freshwater metagenome TaxID=449393 RepID=A0A6J7G4M9_9ZZZZ